MIGLIPLAAEDRYLFTGVYHVKSMREQEEGVGYFYDLEPEERVLEYAGRLVIDIVFRDRARYRYAESLSDRLKIVEFKEEKLSLSDFPGYHNVDISKSELDMIIRQNIPTWRGALESVAGIYLISDTQNGQHYVGSATGLGGISITPRGRHFAGKVLSGNKRAFLFFNLYTHHRISQHQHMGDIQ